MAAGVTRDARGARVRSGSQQRPRRGSACRRSAGPFALCFGRELAGCGLARGASRGLRRLGTERCSDHDRVACVARVHGALSVSGRQRREERRSEVRARFEARLDLALRCSARMARATVPSLAARSTKLDKQCSSAAALLGRLRELPGRAAVDVAIGGSDELEDRAQGVVQREVGDSRCNACLCLLGELRAAPDPDSWSRCRPRGGPPARTRAAADCRAFRPVRRCRRCAAGLRESHCLWWCANATSR